MPSHCDAKHAIALSFRSKPLVVSTTNVGLTISSRYDSTNATFSGRNGGPSAGWFLSPDRKQASRTSSLAIR